MGIFIIEFIIQCIRTIWTLSIAGDNKINLTNNADNYYSPVWSPDGSKIAFASQQSENKIDIFVMNTDGSDKINITTD